MSQQIHVSKIIPHVLNPRTKPGDIDGLAQSITLHGLMEPIVVCEHPGKPGYYLLIAGWRRWLATKKAGMDWIQAEIRPVPRTSARARILMLVENDHREDLDPVDRAKAYGELRKSGMTVKHIAIAVSKSQSTISYHLGLLDLDEASQQRVREGTVSVGDAHERIVEVRQETRRRSGGKRMGSRRKVATEPAWFTNRHPLAGIVRDMCDHHSRPKLGKGTGCGQCWEQAIRQDTDQPAGAADPALATSAAARDAASNPPKIIRGDVIREAPALPAFRSEAAS